MLPRVRVDLRTYRRATVFLLGGAALVGALAGVFFNGKQPLAGTLVGLIAVVMAVATFVLEIRGDLRGHTVMLLTRQECVLCEEAKAALESWRDDLGYALWVVDVDEAGGDVLATYSARLPVVIHQGEVLMELDFDAQALRAILFDR